MPLCVFEMRCVLSYIGLVELRWILMKVGYALWDIFREIHKFCLKCDLRGVCSTMTRFVRGLKPEKLLISYEYSSTMTRLGGLKRFETPR